MAPQFVLTNAWRAKNKRNDTVNQQFYKSLSGDEIPERDVTYHLITSYDYLFSTKLRRTCTSGIFSK